MVIETSDILIVGGSLILVGIMIFVLKKIEWNYKAREQLIKAKAVQIIESRIKPDKRSKKESKKETKKEKDLDADIKYFHALKTRKSKLSFRYWRDLMMDRKHPDQTLLINMEMTNGFHRTFLIRNREGQFKYRNRTYIIDNDLKYFNLDSKLYQLDYHENLTIPVKRIIPVKQIMESIKATKIVPMQSTNPANIEKFILSKVLESLMKGGQFIESLRKFSFYLIIIMSIAVIHFLLFVYGSGMLKDFKVPGF